METAHKKILKSLILEIRHLLEGYFTPAGDWVAGDLEQRLRSLGVRRDRDPVPVDELRQLTDADLVARQVVDAYVTTRQEAGVGASEAVVEFIRETAFTWANRLVAIRCMEARGVIDYEVVLTKPAYAGRSLLHQRLVRRSPELERREDGGIFAAFDHAFAELAERLPLAFDTNAPGIALRPSVATLKTCIALLSGAQSSPGQDAASDDVFKAPDALGWAYQYWNTEEKQRVFDAAAGKGPDRKRHKVEGANIVPATQLYTEPYMVKFLVQNSLGALWASAHPHTALAAGWEFFVPDVDAAPTGPRAPDTLMFLDPACGSGHFLLEAFDMLFSIYGEDDPARSVDSIVVAILTKNLHGIDIDQRAVEIAEIALWMKAAEKLDSPWEFLAPELNLVATNLRLPAPALDRYLAGRALQQPLKSALARVVRAFSEPPLTLRTLGEVLMDRASRLSSILAAHPAAAGCSDDLHEVLEGLPDRQELGRLLLDDQIEKFLVKHPEDRPLLPALQVVFEGLAHADELGALLLLKEPVENELRLIKQREDRTDAERVAERQTKMFRRGEQTALPLSALSFEDWRDDVFGRLQAHFAEEAGAADLVQAFFGRSVKRALGLFDLLSLRYDVVAANPPYMGSGNHGPVLADHLARHLPAGKTDLFAAFMLRCAGLAADGGCWATVTPRSWLTLGSYEGLRRELYGVGILRVAADLGAGAFEEISGEVVTVVLSVNIRGTPRTAATRTVFLDARLRQSAQKRELLDAPRHEFPNARLSVLPGLRYSYGLSQDEVNLFSQHRPLRERCFMTIGLITGDNGRFVRYLHEIAAGDRWKPYLKSQSNRRWAGNVSEAVDWEGDGRRIRARYADNKASGGKYNGEEFYGRPGLAATRVGGGKLRSQLFPPGLLFDSAASCGFASSTALLNATCALLNSELGQRLAVELNGSFNFQAGDLNVLPMPDLQSEDLDAVSTLVGAANALASGALTRDPLDLRFEPDSAGLQPAGLEGGVDPLLGVERSIDEWVYQAWGIRPGISPAQADPSEDTSAPEAGAGEAAERGASNELSPSEEAVSVVLLRCLGHIWMSEAKSPLSPSGVDADGVVPVTFVPGETNASQLLRACLKSPGPLDDLGVSLETWIQKSFFLNHISRFKKRPIAWQIQSGSFSPRRAPGFACFLYAQRITGDTLSRVRTHYVAPWQERLESERRGLQRIESRSAEQALRFDELQAHTNELILFETRLRGIEESGFYSGGLAAIAVQDAIQSLVKPLLVRFRAELTPNEARWCQDANAIDTTLGVALTSALDRLPFACARAVAAERVEAAGEPAIRSAVIAAASRLFRFALIEAVDGWDRAFDAWVATQRQSAVAAGRKPPKLKQEKDAAASLRARIRAWSPATLELPSFVAGLPLFDQASGEPGKPVPATLEEFVRSESAYRPDVNDGVRVNIAPLQKAGVLAAEVLAPKDVSGAIADRAAWRADERRWVREGKLPQPGWWPKEAE